MKKKTFWIAAAAAVFLLTACGRAAGGQTEAGSQTPDGQQASDSGKPLQIVATIFPEYDWVMNVLGENPGSAEVKLLLDNGVDMHSFQPSVADIVDISTCDLLIYVGGPSDSWLDDALKEGANPDRTVVSLMDVLDGRIKEEEIVEGMQEEEHDHDGAEEAHPGGEHEDGEEEPEYDEHVWLSLRNSTAAVKAIAKALSALDAANADVYRANADAYAAQLSELDAQYEETVQNAAQKTLLFADRFPFRYLTEDYGLSYYAAFAGCSAETEASFETVTFLAQKADELSLSVILTIDGSDQKIAKTIIQNTKTKDQTILVLDSLQSTTAKDIEDGTTYLSVMEENLAVLREALQ